MDVVAGIDVVQFDDGTYEFNCSSDNDSTVSDYIKMLEWALWALKTRLNPDDDDYE